MMLVICRPPGIVYEGETVAEAREKDRLIAEHNEMVEQEWKKWGRPDPVEAYKQWYRQRFGVEYDA